MMLEAKDLLRLQNGSDIRGVAMDGVEGEPVTLTAAAVSRIAAAFVRFISARLNKPTREIVIAVGNDSRLTADALRAETLSAIGAMNARSLDCGLSSTPAMFMATVFDETRADGAIMLTASHLPFNRNGMKFFTRDGGLEKDDIKAMLLDAANERPNGDGRAASPCALITRYSRFLRDTIKSGIDKENSQPLSGMHIIVDAGNGAGGFFATEVLALLGADISGSLYLEPDGHFPNHVPNPEDASALVAIQKAVVEKNADLGLIFDTDVDRMSAILSDGTEIARNSLIAMIAAIIAEDYPGSTIVTDSVTSDELTDFLENELHLVHHRFKRGYKNVINECIRLNESGTVSPLAIETSGHGALMENHYLDDGAYLAVKLIIASAKLSRSGRSLKSLIDKLRHPAEARECRLKITADDFHSAGDKALEIFEKRASEAGIKIASPSYEGVRLIFDEGWALLRMSLHDPVMPLNIEGREKGSLARIIPKLSELLSGIYGLDISPLNYKNSI
ncbi:MAG: phosphomannomutase/phosphoglucomutase [Schwartzia sp.]|nr:phosphomannomutase/phosphoglucomutase [Schwartzia sp. (in: firmicutes)]